MNMVCLKFVICIHLRNTIKGGLVCVNVITKVFTELHKVQPYLRLVIDHQQVSKSIKAEVLAVFWAGAFSCVLTKCHNLPMRGMPQQIHSKVTLCNSQITYKNNKHYILASIGLNMLKFMIVNL